MSGGYDDGYEACKCFWGEEPGSLITILSDVIDDYTDLNILDVGCGEGKNAIHLARLGANVDAFDISKHAIENAKSSWSDYNLVNWECADIREKKIGENKYDIIIAYGLLHCMQNKETIENIINKLKIATVMSGYNVVCAFNDRHHDLSAHPDFHPTTLEHSFYLNSYRNWNVIFDSDEDLFETHPHNNIPHSHSMTRIIFQKDN